MMKIALTLTLLLLCDATARAATVDEIIALSKAGVSDTVLLALIDRDGSVFMLDADELLTLKQARVSDAVVVAMLKSGHPQSAADAALASAMPPLVAPDVVVVGHGPDVPNTSSGRALVTVSASDTFVPYFFAAPSRRPVCVPVTAVESTGPLLTTAPAVGHMTSNPFRPFSNAVSEVVAVACSPAVPRAPGHGRR